MKNDECDCDGVGVPRNDADPGKEQYQAELVRIRARRRGLKTRVPLGTGSKQSTLWGLALSGGGIRSATFCLGVLQAMARAKPPATRAAYAGKSKDGHLLPHFDYLSTVSGGGYIGAFFCSLFQGGRLRPYVPRSGQTEDPIHRPDPEPAEELAQKAALYAYEVLQFEPPGRIHSGTNYEKRAVGDAPTAWLRENGRYLTPSGAGDLFYGIALTIRNWISLHFVFGMPILFILALLNVIQLCMKAHMPQEIGSWQAPGLLTSLWLLPAFVTLAGFIPNVLAFWLFYSNKNVDKDEPTVANAALVSCLGLILLFGVLAWYYWSTLPVNLRWTLVLSIPMMALAMVWAIWTAYSIPIELRTVRAFRVKITKHLSITLKVLLVVGLMVAVFELSRALYHWLSLESQWWTLSPAAVLAGIVWVTRTVAGLLDDRAEKNPLLKLPLPWLATVLGGAMFCLVVLCWGVLLHWFVTEPCFWKCSIDQIVGSWILLDAAAALVVIGGFFIGFLNLSSLQAFYSARLTRAYLGASNGFRFEWSPEEETRRRKLSVSDALPGDDLPLEDYYGANSLAPLHLINITLNLTSDPVGQLVQRDRKGLPLCIAPSTYTTGVPHTRVSFTYRFILDGIPRDRVNKKVLLSEADQPLTLGHWIATSGAAFSTGLGRTTSLGLSLVCGLANVRLGTWWPANFVNNNDPKEKRGSRKDRWLAKYLPTSYYLFNEFTATFHGLQRDYQYLSDGGHFENTAAYELLRPGRRLDLIVLCDCGADPEYRFEDLSNLIRLARLDLNLEIEADTGYRSDYRFEELNNVIGTFEDFLTGTVLEDKNSDSKLADDQCALLFNVFNRDEDSKPRKLVCVLLVIKPNIIPRVSDDVQHYSVTHPSFPNEPTINQFFNEAQFESYRQLGLNIGQLLFGSGRPAPAKRAGKKRKSYESLLWAYLEQQLNKIDRSSDQNPPTA